MRKETGSTDDLRAEASATGLTEAGRDQHQDSDICGSQPIARSIKRTEESINSFVYRSDMAFPVEILPEFSFDSFSVKILTLGLLVFLVAAFLAVYP